MILKSLNGYSRYLFDSIGNIFRKRKYGLQKLKNQQYKNGYLYKNLYHDNGTVKILESIE